MKRIKNFNDFINSNVNEGIFSKIARSFTGADRKEVNAQVNLKTYKKFKSNSNWVEVYREYIT